MIPQIIVLVLCLIELGYVLAKDGEPKNNNYSFIVTLIGNIIMLALLWWGGFFDIFFK